MVVTAVAVVASLVSAGPARADGGHEHPSPYPEVNVHDASTWADPSHPSYAYKYDPTVADRYLVDEVAGCRVDHPYMAWLVDATKRRFETDLRTMRDALLLGYTPLSPIPNDIGYPDTYWHWIKPVEWVNQPDRSTRSGDPWTMRDSYVNPDKNIEWLLMIPAAKLRSTNYRPHLDEPERVSEGWVPAGALYWLPRDAPSLELYNGCEPFHDHPENQGVDSPHIHLWPYHHVNPLAFNPPHMCEEDGDMRPSTWPFRPEGAYGTCLYPDGHEEHEEHAGSHETAEARGGTQIPRALDPVRSFGN
jgi:hypothetical protein